MLVDVHAAVVEKSRRVGGILRISPTYLVVVQAQVAPPPALGPPYQCNSQLARHIA
jgi:hypothetical protein